MNNSKELHISERNDYDSTEHKQSFSEFIKDMRRGEISPSGRKYLSTKELAERLGINPDQLKKILNMNRPTKKRDCIIAICAALRMELEDTNDALLMYRYMPTLEPASPRDELLIEIFRHELFENPLTIEQINERLKRHNFPELDIIDHKPSNCKTPQNSSSAFEVVKRGVNSFTTDLIFGDQYNSLKTEYSTERYRCAAYMIIDDKKDKKVYRLHASTDDRCSMEIYGKDLFDIKVYNSAKESGAFEDYYRELQGMAKEEYRRNIKILNDTKNYKERVSANVMNDSFQIFAETFNYDVPELNEYYLYRMIDGNGILEVHKSSVFMRYYLPEDKYKSCFGKFVPELVTTYNSIEELEALIAEAKTMEEFRLKSRLKHFKRLKEKTDMLLDDIKAKKQFVRNLEYIYDGDDDRVCQFFSVEQEFECNLTSEDKMCAHKDNADFVITGAKERINITKEDLYQAFKLGCNDIQEICRIKKKYGSIKKII